jgi:hypothetical protein
MMQWKKYSQLVEKTLQSFDNVNEWADFITFLAKLLKVRSFSISSRFAARWLTEATWSVVPTRLPAVPFDTA